MKKFLLTSVCVCSIFGGTFPAIAAISADVVYEVARDTKNLDYSCFAPLAVEALKGDTKYQFTGIYNACQQCIKVSKGNHTYRDNVCTRFAAKIKTTQNELVRILKLPQDSHTQPSEPPSLKQMPGMYDTPHSKKNAEQLKHATVQWGSVITPTPFVQEKRTACPVYNLSVNQYEPYWACRKIKIEPYYPDGHHGECCSLEIMEDIARHDCGSGGDMFSWGDRCYFVASSKNSAFYNKCKGKRTYFSQWGWDTYVANQFPQKRDEWINYCLESGKYMDKWCVCN